MNHFPLSIDLTGRTVLLVGSGPQIRDKYEKLLPFGAELRQVETLSEGDLSPSPAFVVAGDLEKSEAARVSALCQSKGIPVNVVDQPELCSFYFPALIARGSLTVSVSSGGKSPAAAAHLRRTIEAVLPDRTEEILDWLASLRGRVPRRVLTQAAAKAFGLGRPLSEQELPIE